VCVCFFYRLAKTLRTITCNIKKILRGRWYVFVWILEKGGYFALYNITRLVFMTKVERVYCEYALSPYKKQ
jgi:hypothetical protein